MVAMMTCVLLSAILSACGPSISPLTLELRTADTHAPIANAAIAADSLALGPSLQASDIVDELMGRRVAFSSKSITNEAGLAPLEAIPGRAVRITLIAPGRTPGFRLVTDTSAHPTVMWLDAEGTTNMQFRVGPP